MSRDDLVILTGPDIRRILEGRQRDVMAAVGAAYVEHYRGNSCLPHSVFVRFPERTKERIIALPGYLGGESEIAGIKWISSFPGNLDLGISRASAVMVLNSLETGRAQALLEGSLISAARTAASAALAADKLHEPGAIDVLGVVGCGLINREIVSYIARLGRDVRRVELYDTERRRAEAFAETLTAALPEVAVGISGSVRETMARANVLSLATTAVVPTIDDLSICPAGATLLHISLRDIVADAIVGADNIVDDVDHAIRAQTSLHLAEQKLGHRQFVRGTLAQVLLGEEPARADAKRPVVFSPFGLGVLDLAVAKLVMSEAARAGAGQRVADFFAGT
jgi:N-[(2S)-2-amino-2-carboxyethyl]-L-glutamate dehydrogenase